MQTKLVPNWLQEWREIRAQRRYEPQLWASHFSYAHIIDHLEGFYPNRKSHITLTDDGWWLITFEQT